MPIGTHMATARTRLPARARLGMAAAAVLLAACTDTPSQPELIHPTSAPSRVLEGDVYRSSAEIVCDAVVATVTVTCSSKQDTAGSPSHVGGKGMHVRLVTTAPAYNAAGQVFSVKIAVRNLLVQQIGTPDGSTITGIRPFVISLGRSGGTGSIELLNYDSTGTGTQGSTTSRSYRAKQPT